MGLSLISWRNFLYDPKKAYAVSLNFWIECVQKKKKLLNRVDCVTDLVSLMFTYLVYDDMTEKDWVWYDVQYLDSQLASISEQWVKNDYIS